MNMPAKLVVSAAFLGGFAALVASPASAMPVATEGLDAGPATEQVHAVRVCGPRGCYYTTAGHRHGWRRYGWRPYRHYGWRHHPYHGWHGHHHWR